jgi:aryl carrier-like protein
MGKRQDLEQLHRKLADEGRLIEAGWIALRIMAMAEDATAIQVAEMRLAYMAGAQHLFASMMAILAPVLEETEADLTRMDLIQKELETFRAELLAKWQGRKH